MLPYTLTYDTVDGITAFVSGPGLPADGTDYMLATEAERMRGVACSAYLAGMRRAVVLGTQREAIGIQSEYQRGWSAGVAWMHTNIEDEIASLEKELADADRT